MPQLRCELHRANSLSSRGGNVVNATIQLVTDDERSNRPAAQGARRVAHARGCAAPTVCDQAAACSMARTS